MDIEHQLPISSSSKFDLASVGKHFTCACILLLNSRNVIHVNDKVEKYIPELKNLNISLWNLITHTSGLPDYLSMEDITFEDNEHVVQVITKDLKLDFLPGENHEYSNTNYVMLAVIIERVSNKTYKQFVEENILNVVGMKDSLVMDRSTNGTIIPNRCIGYMLDENQQLVVNQQDLNANGDGGILSSIDDLSKWDKVLSNKLKDIGVSEELFDQYYYKFGSSSKNGYHGYAMGWADAYQFKITERYNQRQHSDKPMVVYHSGMWCGTTMYLRFLDVPLSIVLLSNVNYNLDLWKMIVRLANESLNDYGYVSDK
jgi:CubicO group peptidase (beta-lactamase class C family)